MDIATASPLTFLRQTLWVRRENSIVAPAGLQQSRILGRAALAGAVEGQVMRCHGEALLRKLCRPDIPVAFDDHIKDTIANFADEMLMPSDQGIEML